MYRDKIRKIQTDLSPSFTRVAEFCLDHYTEVAFMTVSELARAVDVDAATIVRFAQRLGYPGYPELQDEIREEVKKQLYALERVVPTSNKPDALMNAALKQMERNVEVMRTSLDGDVFKQFVSAIRKAPRVHVVAHGPMRGQAHILRAALMNVGKMALLSDGDPLNLAISIQYIGNNDVVIALETEAALSVMEKLLPLARERGARTAVLVGQESFLAARDAEWVFHTPNQSILQSPSHVSAAAFISGLYQVLLQPEEAQATERYEAVYAALVSNDGGALKPHTVA